MDYFDKEKFGSILFFAGIAIGFLLVIIFATDMISMVKYQRDIDDGLVTYVEGRVQYSAPKLSRVNRIGRDDRWDFYWDTSYKYDTPDGEVVIEHEDINLFARLNVGIYYYNDDYQDHFTDTQVGLRPFSTLIWIAVCGGVVFVGHKLKSYMW